MKQVIDIIFKTFIGLILALAVLAVAANVTGNQVIRDLVYIVTGAVMAVLPVWYALERKYGMFS